MFLSIFHDMWRRDNYVDYLCDDLIEEEGVTLDVEIQQVLLHHLFLKVKTLFFKTEFL